MKSRRGHNRSVIQGKFRREMETGRKTQREEKGDPDSTIPENRVADVVHWIGLTGAEQIGHRESKSEHLEADQRHFVN